MYQINIAFKNEKHHLSIMFEDKVLKKWQGKFAELITREIVYNIYHKEDSFLLCKNHMNIFLHQITMLYRSAIICHNIEWSLDSLELDCNKYNIAEVILLNLRIQDDSLNNNDLITILIDDFPNHNFLKFYEVIELLVNKKLIEKVDKGSNQIFYRNNITEYKNYSERKDNAHIDDQKNFNPDISITLI